MKRWKKGPAHLAWCGVLVSTFPMGVSQAFCQEPAPQHAPAANAAQSEALPDSPGTIRMAELNPDTPSQQTADSTQGQQSSDSSQTQAPPPPAQAQTPSAGQKPVGTAAAETPNVSGVAASQPAGVAIAPAKQRRTRTLVLRMGALIGAGVAVGTVVGLTRATGSKPPGAH